MRIRYMILVLSLLILTGCSETKETLRVGVNDWPPCEVWYVAQEQGFFGDLDVEIVRFTTWTDNMNALYLGNVDVTHSTYFNNIYYSGKGEWGQMIAPIDTTLGGDGMVIRQDIEGIAAMKGKRIAVEVGTDEHYLLYKALESEGIDIDDVTIISASSATTKELFVKGEVDGIFTYEPYMSQAVAEGDGKIVFTTEDLPNVMVDVLVGSADKMNKSQSSYVALLNAYYKALEYIDETGSYEMMAANEAMEPEAFEAFFGQFQFFEPGEALALIDSDAYDQIHEDMAGFVIDKNLSTGIRPKDELINRKILKDVIDIH